MSAGAPTALHLAEVNIAIPREPLDSARLADFVAGLEPVNTLAERSPGFVWRLKTAAGDATAVRGFGDDRIIVNLSVWESPESLRAFVFGAEHVAYLRRRREWFERLGAAETVLWWVPAGHRPTVAEAEQRLGTLRTAGPGPDAFTLRRVVEPVS